MSCGTGFFLNENAISAVPVASSIGATNQLFDKAYQVHIAASRVVSLSLSVPVGFTALPSLLQRSPRRRIKGPPGCPSSKKKPRAPNTARGRTWKIVTN